MKRRPLLFAISATVPAAALLVSAATAQTATSSTAQKPASCPAISKTSSSTSKGSSAGQFGIKNGQIIDPNGSVFVARGINVDDSQMGDASKMLADFPGLNFVRVAVGSGADPSNLPDPSKFSSFVQTMTAAGVVVEIEDHPWGSGDNPQPTPYMGSQLTTETNWYASVASMYKNNPYVWFGTMNEPENGPGIQAQKTATYNAIRGTGSNAMVMIEAGIGGGNPSTVGDGGGYGGPGSADTGSDFANMTNIVWDQHFYGGWGTNDTTDVNALQTALYGSSDSHTGIAGTQTIKSADGTIPVIVGETGYAATGVNDGVQVLQAVFTDPQISGAVAWAWQADPSAHGDQALSMADDLTDGQGNLTTYGKIVAGYIGGTPPCPFSVPPLLKVTNPKGVAYGVLPFSDGAVGNILDQQGGTFVPRGVNIPEGQEISATALLAELKGLNFIRYTITDYAPPALLAKYVNDWTAAGIVVEIADYHNSSGASPQGTAMQAGLAWYSAVAEAFKDNQAVWIGTNSQPTMTASSDPKAESSWQVQAYQAIRTSGNDSIVMLEIDCGQASAQAQCKLNYPKSTYTDMYNVVWDGQFFGAMTKGNKDQATNDTFLKSMVQQAEQFTSSGNVKIPLIVGAYGLSTTGQVADPNGGQIVTAVHQAVLNGTVAGSAAWEMSQAMPGDALVNSAGSLTAYGQTVAAYLATSPSAGAGLVVSGRDPAATPSAPPTTDQPTSTTAEAVLTPATPTLPQTTPSSPAVPDALASGPPAPSDVAPAALTSASQVQSSNAATDTVVDQAKSILSSIPSLNP